jgi:hypothetical protein
MGFLATVQAKYDEILAMAFNRKKAIAKLDGLQIPIAKHIYLVVHYGKSEARNHWIRELRAWNGELRLHNVGKRGSKNYTRAMLWQALWEEPLGGEMEQREIAAQVAAKENLPAVEPDAKKLKAVLTKFVDAVLSPATAYQFDP